MSACRGGHGSGHAVAISMLPDRIGGGEQARQSEEGGALDGDGEGAERSPAEAHRRRWEWWEEDENVSTGCSLDMDSWCATPTHPHI